MSEPSNVVEMAAEIISAYVSANTVRAEDLPALIVSVYASLRTAEHAEVEPEASVEKPTPAQIKKSITDAGVVSFEDGKTYKSMKRSLALRGLTPQQYREKWGLPKDYPMVSPAYARSRSELAKQMGLGSKGRTSSKTVAGPRARKKVKGPVVE